MRRMVLVAAVVGLAARIAVGVEGDAVIKPEARAAWGPHAIETAWDDLLAGVKTKEDLAKKREEMRIRFLALLRDEAKPAKPAELRVKVEEEWKDREGFTIRRITYQVEADERAQAYVAIPGGARPAGGFPAVLCIHGTTNWGARQTLGLEPDASDPHANRKGAGPVRGDFARALVKAGFVTISPEHFCSGSRLPKEGPFDTAAFYRKHPKWTAIGKSTWENAIALDVLCGFDFVDKERIGATGHSLGGHNSIFIGAYDPRVKCVAASSAAPTIRENPEPLNWSRNQWYVYIPQIREKLLRGERVETDFHEMISLVSPRPMLDLFALNDGDGLMQAQRVMMHLKVREVYRLQGAEGAHALVVGGDGHSQTDLGRVALVSWMKRWLMHGGDALGEWKAGAGK
jgi:dienelactone hydrolase